MSTEPNGRIKRQIFADEWKLRKLTEELEHQKAREPIFVFITTTATTTASSHFFCRLRPEWLRNVTSHDVRKLRFSTTGFPSALFTNGSQHCCYSVSKNKNISSKTFRGLGFHPPLRGGGDADYQWDSTESGRENNYSVVNGSIIEEKCSQRRGKILPDLGNVVQHCFNRRITHFTGNTRS